MASTLAFLVPRARAVRPPARASRTAAPPLPLGTALRWAVVVAVCMSTQYLFQPFVWRHWSVPEVLAGWTEVVRDRLLVAVLIALALAAAARLPVRGLVLRAAVLALAIVTGALAGEYALVASGSPEPREGLFSVLGHAIQWTGLALCAAGTYFLWRRDAELRSASRKNALARSRVEALLVQTQLQLLRQQVEPHFLFNTLATIRRLQETAPVEGQRLLRHLRAYLQAAATASSRRTTLGDEAELVQSYLAVVAMRLAGRLTVQFDVPDALRGCECPPLSLATLVENAVKHGITPAPEGGVISVRARRDGEVLELVVADTGVGMSDSGAAPVAGAGIGLANTRARLRMLYGTSASLSITANNPRGVRAVIRVPARGQES